MNENQRPFKRDWKERTELPNDVLRSDVLRWREKLVLVALVQHWPNIRPSYDRLATECHISRQTVKRAISTLKQYGVIEIIEKGGYNNRTNVYIVHDIPEMWAAKTPKELTEACQLAQQQYEQHESDNVVDFPKKKESPASVGADAGESAGMKTNIVDSHCTTIPASCQSELLETDIETTIESVKTELPWIGSKDCERLIIEAKKVIEEEKIVDYIRFCVGRMQTEENKGKAIISKTAYLIGVIRKMREQYRQIKSMASTKPSQEYEYGDMERLFDELYPNGLPEDDADWLYKISHPDESQKNDT